MLEGEYPENEKQELMTFNSLQGSVGIKIGRHDEGETASRQGCPWRASPSGVSRASCRPCH